MILKFLSFSLVSHPISNSKLCWIYVDTKNLETLLDLLELYTHHRNQTAIGPDFAVETFLETRIPLNKECQEKHLPRFTAWIEESRLAAQGTHASGIGNTGTNPRSNGMSANGSHNQHSRGGGPGKNISPRDVNPSMGNNPTRTKVGERGKDGTIRFILNPDRETEERRVVETFTRA